MRWFVYDFLNDLLYFLLLPYYFASITLFTFSIFSLKHCKKFLPLALIASAITLTSLFTVILYTMLEVIYVGQEGGFIYVLFSFGPGILLNTTSTIIIALRIKSRNSPTQENNKK